MAVLCTLAHPQRFMSTEDHGAPIWGGGLGYDLAIVSFNVKARLMLD